MRTLEVPALPAGDHVPSTGQMVDLLLGGFPERDRGQARALLDGILRGKMAGVAEHPRPRRLAEVAYEEVADSIRNVHPEQRLATLRSSALHAQGQALSAGALSLAIARYLRDHPTALSRVADWADEPVRRWRVKPVEGIQAEATRRLENLESWAKQLQASHPESWEPERVTYAHAKLALQSARSGSFDTAAGSLQDFLRAVGAPVKSLDIH